MQPEDTTDDGSASGALPDDPAVTAARLAAGKALFSREWRFLLSVTTMAQLPETSGVEVAFAGRSNVGKSSLINALIGQKGLARTSNTPGRTQQLNYFINDGPLAIVDMPGYGYAKAPKKLVDDWTRLVLDYLRGRPNLRRVYVLIDSRHGLKENDLAVLKVLDQAAVSYQAVLTKVDKLKPPAVGRVLAEVVEALRKRPAAHPVVLATSSEKGEGIDELRAEIADLA